MTSPVRPVGPEPMVSPDDIDPEVVARERAIFSEQARESGKPEAVIEKMIEGGVRKFAQEATLVNQIFVIDGKSKVADVVAAAAKAAGTPIALKGFVRMQLGEGIEKQQSDFAAEVAAAAGR